jgi:hypothetical protein
MLSENKGLTNGNEFSAPKAAKHARRAHRVVKIPLLNMTLAV